MIDTLQSEPVAVPEPPANPTIRTVVAYSAITALMYVTPAIVFLPAALLHCGIRYGSRAALLALPFGVALGALITFQFGVPAELRTDFAYFLISVLSIGVPTLIMLPMVERGEPFGRVVLHALVGSLAGLWIADLLSTALLRFSPYADYLTATRASAAKFADVYVKNGMSAANAKTITSLSVFCMTGFVMIFIAAIFIISMVIFGRLRAWREMVEKREVVLSAPYLFRNLAFPDWLLFAFIAGGLSPLTKGVAQHVGANILTVVVFLYLLQGLAIVRSVLVAMGASVGMNIIAYGLLLLLSFAGSPLLLALAGLFDPFFDFRHFNKKRKDDSDESHFD